MRQLKVFRLGWVVVRQLKEIELEFVNCVQPRGVVAC
jgi:hypothetical protein